MRQSCCDSQRFSLLRRVQSCLPTLCESRSDSPPSSPSSPRPTFLILISQPRKSGNGPQAGLPGTWPLLSALLAEAQSKENGELGNGYCLHWCHRMPCASSSINKCFCKEPDSSQQIFQALRAKYYLCCIFFFFSLTSKKLCENTYNIEFTIFSRGKKQSFQKKNGHGKTGHPHAKE